MARGVVIITGWCLWCYRHGVSLPKFTWFIWWTQTQCQAAANPETKPTNLGCESNGRLLPTTSAITIDYCWARKLILVNHSTEAGSWVNLCTAARVHSPCLRMYIAVAVMINITAGGEIQTRVFSHCMTATCYVSNSVVWHMPPIFLHVLL